jgi:hypothetical protein
LAQKVISSSTTWLRSPRWSKAVSLAQADEPGVFVGIVEFAVVSAIEVEAGGVQVSHRYFTPEAEPFDGPPGDQALDLGEPEGVQRVKRLAQRVGRSGVSGLIRAPTSRSVGLLRKN